VAATSVFIESTRFATLSDDLSQLFYRGLECITGVSGKVWCMFGRITIVVLSLAVFDTPWQALFSDIWYGNGWQRYQ